MSRNKCGLCGHRTLFQHQGPVTCASCNHFFRQAVRGAEDSVKCRNSCIQKNIFDFQQQCHGCKFSRCIAIGMDPGKIKQPVQNLVPSRQTPKHDFERLVMLTHHQRHSKQMVNKISRSNISTACSVEIDGKRYARASCSDINTVLKFGLLDARQFARRFESFENLKQKDKNLVLSEFGIAYMLIDQAFETVSKSTDKNVWILQNDSFLHMDLLFKIPVEDVTSYDIFRQKRCHSNFVDQLQRTLLKPFRKLKIDVFECMILKILLLFTPTFPTHHKLQDPQRMVFKCFTSLQWHSIKLSKEKGIERFGEVILLIGAIRSAVKSFYNMTKSTELFKISRGDSFVDSILLT